MLVHYTHILWLQLSKGKTKEASEQNQELLKTARKTFVAKYRQIYFTAITYST